MKFHFISSNAAEAIKAKDEYINYYTQTDPELSDIIIPIGGDGILLKSLHDFNELNKPFFGINYGSIGFLMNSVNNKNLEELIENSNSTDLKPLKMVTENAFNQCMKLNLYSAVETIKIYQESLKKK